MNLRYLVSRLGNIFTQRHSCESRNPDDLGNGFRVKARNDIGHSFVKLLQLRDTRAYYAMFYSAEAVLLTKDLSFSSHKGVISAFGGYFVKTDVFPRDMGRELNRAFEKRQLGDYEYTFVISKDEAEEILRKSKGFAEEITRYLKEGRFLS